MDIIKAFNSNNLHTEITIKGTTDDPLFRASDIGLILDIKNIHTTIKDFDTDEKVLHTMDTPGGNQKIMFLTEIGLYRLLGLSRKPIARNFQKWVAKVIKEIRITGKYELEKQLTETQNKLNQFIDYDEELFWNDNQINNFDNKNVIYIAFIGIIKNERIYKFGKSEQIYTRDFKQHQKFFDTFKMRFVIECDNMSFVEKEFKKFLKSINLLKNITIKESNLTELFIIKEKHNIDSIINQLIKLVDDNPLLAVKNLLDILKQKNDQLKLADYEIKQKNYEIGKYIITIEKFKEELNISNLQKDNLEKNLNDLKIKYKYLETNIINNSKLIVNNKDNINYAYEILKIYKNPVDKLKKIIEFNTEYLIDSNKFEFLCFKQIKESLTEFEKQQKYTYDVAINIWNFKSIKNVSEEFFKNYIGHYSQNQKILDIYYIMLRNHELKNTLEKNKQQFLLKIKELIDENKDYNFRLLQINKKKFYEKLIQGQNLLNFINIDRSQVINRKDFNNNVDKFFESLNEEEYKKIKNLYDLNHNKKYNTLKEITDYRSKLLITKKILNETFNIEILYNKNKIKILEFNFNFWSNFYNIYNINKVEDNYLFK
jgi:prophage antirepressor-like protein